MENKYDKLHFYIFIGANLSKVDTRQLFNNCDESILDLYLIKLIIGTLFLILVFNLIM